MNTMSMFRPTPEMFYALPIGTRLHGIDNEGDGFQAMITENGIFASYSPETLIGVFRAAEPCESAPYKQQEDLLYDLPEVRWQQPTIPYISIEWV